MTSLNPSLRLALINKAKTKKNLAEKGFTLIELMVVVGIVGVLSAVALPQFLGAREKAGLGAQISEAVALAKECSTMIGVNGPYPTIGTTGNTGIVIERCSDGTDKTTKSSANATYTTNKATADTSGSQCGSITLDSGEDCEVTVDIANGQITYAVATSG